MRSSVSNSFLLQWFWVAVPGSGVTYTKLEEKRLGVYECMYVCMCVRARTRSE